MLTEILITRVRCMTNSSYYGWSIVNCGYPYEWRCTESTVKKEKLLTESP